MKKTISMLVALVLGYGIASSQETGTFNHASIGIGLLGTDGEGIQFAAPIGDFIQVRAGFTTQAAVFGIADGIVSNSVDDLDGINPLKLTIDDIGINSDGTVIDNLDIEGKIRSNNLQLLFDFFPFRNAGFHITAGSYFNLSPQGFVRATATPSRNDGQQVFPGARPNDTEFYGISADPDGKIHLDVQYGCKVVRPYLGLGFGRPVSAKRKVGMNFDMGFAYLGGLNLITYSYYNDANNPEVIKLDAEWIDKNILSDPGISADGRKTANQAKDYLSDADKMPYALLTKFYPVLKLTLFVRLF